MNVRAVEANDRRPADVDLHLENGEYFLSACLNISIPGVERSIAQGLLMVRKGSVPT
jgi:hypothetical protein